MSTIKLKATRGDTCLSILDPYPIYSRYENLCIEYNIYNLSKDTNGLAHYTVLYRIERVRAAQSLYAHGLKSTILYVLKKLRILSKHYTPIISSSFEQSTGRNSDRGEISFGLEKLRSGPYSLSVEIHDKVSDKRISRSAGFLIISSN